MKRLLLGLLAVLNLFEGIIHLGTASIAIWGCWANHIWDWRIMTSPVSDLVFGLVSVLTAFVLGKGHHH